MSGRKRTTSTSSGGAMDTSSLAPTGSKSSSKPRAGASAAATTQASMSPAHLGSVEDRRDAGKRAMQEIRSRVVLEADRVENAASIDFPANFPEEAAELAWDFGKFAAGFRIERIETDPDDPMAVTFDMVGVDAAIANAFRRILIAEVPTMAIETVFFTNNTSIIHDEALAHRLGLVPIRADPRYFETRDTPDTQATDRNTLVFTLDVKCTKNPHASPNATDDTEKYINSRVLSSDIVWVPKGDQEAQFQDAPIAPVHDDILIAKLRPGQAVACEMHCIKSIGRDHAKFSPVGTASYRLLPEIILTRPVTGDDAYLLQKCFSPGTIGVRNENGVPTAYVIDARRDTCSREIFRHERLASAVKMRRVRDHFLFSIESTGALPPGDLLFESVLKLKSKCELILAHLNNATSSVDTTA
ncbi:polymerase I polypeptide C [Capsaspora owczarzaki ATCC 30864]|uniref:DNA-directed RNA polymerases I and III subunit RPAC1 n=1 Tax=Capsaspora owczarzaki (strain ATCC 30864) TaxID=595528 RepID=A0A0D2X5I3_CAPO3|nr:polymerase I polypeptide C [Capsaspora owczarzaki ATCC 30864]KJE97859.1 polymerase I polypeptide C [Capsaspora owczarzaki ATCC 30864]|eukprot:XP_004343029.1 polymerase I polypeptide C [Capsaspora owczarzaki ATCC 30864]